MLISRFIPDEGQNLINKKNEILRGGQSSRTLYKLYQSIRRVALKGSLTLEAALVLPLFLFAVAEIINWTAFLEVEANLSMEVNRRARRIAEERFIEEPLEENVVEVVKGEFLRGRYFTRIAKARSFNGRYYEEEGLYDAEHNLVFVTKEGSVYHRDLNCSHINLKVKSVSYEEVNRMRSDDGSKYYPCEYCMKRERKKKVYITEYGKRIHLRKDCKAIKRSIRFEMLKKAKEKGYIPCKKCGY